MILTIHFGVWTYTGIAMALGSLLLLSDRGTPDPLGRAFGYGGRLPGRRSLIGLLLWLSIPFVWLGTLLSQ